MSVPKVDNGAISAKADWVRIAVDPVAMDNNLLCPAPSLISNPSCGTAS
ncbi:MAG: hypothetical protein QNJ16_19015 [Rhodobacter sp.]|nr:hypothetical protein [Rhodobacter sp.]